MPGEAASDGPRSCSCPSSPPCRHMLQFLLRFTLGNVVGKYLAQRYDIPNLAKNLEEVEKDVDTKKKSPSS
ncbi:hypothetical protein DBR06_SOUSAS20910023 [Sousa chinensis]|nr:hypothetical protein DBR06_SOUSAS20910023 [Sousa chinensis]